MGSNGSAGDGSFIGHPPAHPVPQLQGPFEESMVESVNDVADHETNLDSVARRTMLLEMPKYERVIAGRWKQKPGEQYHPLWKITAQMSFGMHLLAEGVARSEEEVMQILQSHVDDIDGFLERTTEDFDLAQSDIHERLQYLKLPLEHPDVFDRMLEDRTFRMSIVEGNEKIEHIIERTSKAMKDSMKDVQKGLDASKALDKYLVQLDRKWTRTTAEHEAVFVAMMGNVEGWSRAFMDLHLQGNNLGRSLVQLSEIVAEMQKRAGIISRRTLMRPEVAAQYSHHSQKSSHSQHVHANSVHHSSSRPSSATRRSTSKALPTAPGIGNSTRKLGPGPLPRQISSAEKQAVLHGNVISGTGHHRQQTRTPSVHGSLNSTTSSASTPGTKHTVVSELAATEVPLPRKVNSPKDYARSKNISPTELPADVPPQVMFQAPHSRTSRLSTILGLDSKEHSPQKMSSVISAKRLSSLLKSPLPNRMAFTPKSRTSRNTSTSSTTGVVRPESDVIDYFGPDGFKTHKRTKSDMPLHSTDICQEGLGIDGTSSPVNSNSPKAGFPQRNLNTENPTLTSHPPGNMVASPVLQQHGPHRPPDLPSEVRRTGEAQSLLAKNSSNHSSMGKTGPGLAAPVPAISTTATTATPMQGTSLLNAIANRSLLASSRAQTDNAVSLSDRKGPIEESGQATSQIFVAEMEGSSPLFLEPRAFGPAELEAPQQQRLVLPPRPATSSTSKSEDVDKLSATIASQSDFFKLPAMQHADPLDVLTKPNPRRLVPRHVAMPAPVASHHTSASGDDRSSSSPNLLGSALSKNHTHVPPRLRSGLTGCAPNTPPESPIHGRSLSGVSVQSTRLNIEHPSNSLAPPESCPPPPVLEGRSMVIPDGASAGASNEQEPEHRSNGSGGSWKRETSIGSTQMSPTVPRPEPSMQTAGADLLTAGGKDVLWFKGVSRDGLWVT